MVPAGESIFRAGSDRSVCLVGSKSIHRDVFPQFKIHESENLGNDIFQIAPNEFCFFLL